MSETTNTPTQQGDPEALGDAGKKALDQERDRADAAEKKLKAAEARVTDLEAQVQSVTEAAEAATAAFEAEKSQMQKEVGELGAKVSKLTIGIEEKLPLSLIERMQGDDEEALRADAKELAGFVPDNNPSPFPKADPSQGAKGETGGGSNADRFASFMDAKLT